MGEVYSKIVQSLQNRTMIVSSRLGAPFLLKRVPKDGEILEGNARYEGNLTLFFTIKISAKIFFLKKTLLHVMKIVRLLFGFN